MYRMIPDNQVAAFRAYVSSGRQLPSPKTGGVLAWDAQGAFDIQPTNWSKADGARLKRAFDDVLDRPDADLRTLDRPDADLGTDDEDVDPRHAMLRKYLTDRGLSEDECDEAIAALTDGEDQANDNPPDLPLGAMPTPGGGMTRSRIGARSEPTARDQAMRFARRIKFSAGYSPTPPARLAKDSAAKTTTFKPSALVQAIAQRIRIV